MQNVNEILQHFNSLYSITYSTVFVRALIVVKPKELVNEMDFVEQ